MTVNSSKAHAQTGFWSRYIVQQAELRLLHGRKIHFRPERDKQQSTRDSGDGERGCGEVMRRWDGEMLWGEAMGGTDRVGCEIG